MYTPTIRPLSLVLATTTNRRFFLCDQSHRDYFQPEMIIIRILCNTLYPLYLYWNGKIGNAITLCFIQYISFLFYYYIFVLLLHYYHYIIMPLSFEIDCRLNPWFALMMERGCLNAARYHELLVVPLDQLLSCLKLNYSDPLSSN